MWVWMWLGCAPKPVVELPADDPGDALVRSPQVRWQVESGGPVPATITLTHDGGELGIPTADRVEGTGERLGGLTVLGPDGARRVRIDLPSGPVVHAVLPTPEGWLVHDDHRFRRFFDREGRLVWEVQDARSSERVPCNPMRTGNAFVTVYRDLHLVDPGTGEVRSTVPDIIGPCAQMDLDGDERLELLTAGPDVRALDLATTEPRWALENSRYGDVRQLFLADVLPADGPELAVLRDARTVEWIAPRDGARLGIWTIGDPMLDRRTTRASWYPDAGCLLTASHGGLTDLLCQDAEGTVFQRSFRGAPIYARPLVSYLDGRDGEEVLVATAEGEVTAVDVTGRTVWSWRAPGPIYATPLVADVTGNARLEVLVVTFEGVATLLATRGRGTPSVGHHDAATIWRTP